MRLKRSKTHILKVIAAYDNNGVRLVLWSPLAKSDKTLFDGRNRLWFYWELARNMNIYLLNCVAMYYRGISKAEFSNPGSGISWFNKRLAAKTVGVEWRLRDSKGVSDVKGAVNGSQNTTSW